MTLSNNIEYEPKCLAVPAQDIKDSIKKLKNFFCFKGVHSKIGDCSSCEFIDEEVGEDLK